MIVKHFEDRKSFCEKQNVLIFGGLKGQYQGQNVIFSGFQALFSISLDNRMKKCEYLASSTRLSQLEARLNLNPYLSKTSLPTGADAKVFLFLVAQRKIPNRQTHPNLYHWYILMKQFSMRTLEIWEQDSTSSTDDDKLISEYIQSEINAAPKETFSSSQISDKGITLKQKKSRVSIDYTIQSGQTSKKFLNPITEETNGGTSFKNITSNDSNTKGTLNSGAPGAPEELKSDDYDSKLVVECVMEMKLKTQQTTPIEEFKERLEEQKLKLVSLEGKQEKIRVVFKTQAEEIQSLKDRISQWEEIDNIQFRKEKKVSGRGDGRPQKSISPEKIVNNYPN